MEPLYICNIIFTTSVELFAAIAGSIYLKKSLDQSVRPFVIFLWMTVCVEFIALYPWIIYYGNFDYQWFQWIKQSKFAGNGWLFDITNYANVILIGLYYLQKIKNSRYRFIIKFFILSFCFSTIAYTILFNNSYFLEYLNFFIEEVFVILCVVFYLFELFNSNQFLEFYRSAHFYIASGLFLWYLCVMPLYIFDDFFNGVNMLYYNFRILTILFFNIFLYLWFTFGFHYSLNNQKLLVESK